MLHRSTHLAATFGIAALAAGCAAPADGTQAVQRREPAEYRTGSNIPVRDKQPPLTEEQRQRQVDEMRRIQQNQAGMTSGKPGSSP